MQLTFSDLADLSGSAAENAQVHSLSEEARRWYAKGNVAMAQGAYNQAVRIANASPGGYDMAELEYTRQIVYGDAKAKADWDAGKLLVAAGEINSRPQDDSFFAQFSTQPDGSKGGFWEGLDEGVANIKRGNWFFGTNPAAAVSGSLGISPSTAKTGLVIFGIAVAGYALSQGGKVLDFFKRGA